MSKSSRAAHHYTNKRRTEIKNLKHVLNEATHIVEDLRPKRSTTSGLQHLNYLDKKEIKPNGYKFYK